MYVTITIVSKTHACINTSVNNHNKITSKSVQIKTTYITCNTCVSWQTGTVEACRNQVETATVAAC